MGRWSGFQGAGFLHGPAHDRPAKDVQKALLAKRHPGGHGGDPGDPATAAAFHPQGGAHRPAARRAGGSDLHEALSRSGGLSARAGRRAAGARASGCRQQPEPQALAGKILGLLFFNPSLRTLASFQAAMARLGGSSFVITAGQGTWQLETRAGAVMNGAAAEHVREGVPVLASLLRRARASAHSPTGSDLAADLAETSFKEMAASSTSRVINMESAVNHPCQALADWKTLDDLARAAQRAKFVLSWVYHPRALPLAVPAADRAHGRDARHGSGGAAAGRLRAAARRSWRRRAAAAAPSGGSVRETTDRDDALERRARACTPRSGARPRTTAMPRATPRCAPNSPTGACATPGSRARAVDCKLMHCLPVRRNVAVADEVLDGRRSVVQREAYNRMVGADGRAAPPARTATLTPNGSRP